MDGLNLPEGFVQSLAPLLGEELQDFLYTYQMPYLRGLRLNPDKLLPQGEIIQGMGEGIPWEPNGFYLSPDSKAGSSIFHEAGCFYIQEPSAMAAVRALAPQKGEKVLDLCAAPGGKATQIAQVLDSTGLLIANEPGLKRAKILSQNLERMGITNSIVTSALPEQLAKNWPAYFDAILVDAPCSGEGMFRRHPQTRLQWSQGAPTACALRQKEILSHAVSLLKPGGRLCYSTCTLNQIENDDVVRWLSQTYSDMRLKTFTLNGIADADAAMIHLWPHRVKGEGHFIALFEKENCGSGGPTVGEPGLRPVPKDAAKALKEFNSSLPANAMFADTLVNVPNHPNLDGVKVLRAGLHLGGMRGRIFVPDHALAVSAGMKPDLDLSYAQAIDYYQGQALQGDGKGWHIAGYRGISLGFIKASDGQLKNHYPKGLRKKLDR